MVDLFKGVFKNKKILITGHTGFKGSWLSLWLSELGANVIGYALKSPAEPSLFDVGFVKKRITSVEADIRDAEFLNSIFKQYQPEIVFHLAAQSLVRRSYKEPRNTYETNIMGTVNVFEACRNTPSVRAVVNVTSDKCYENCEQPAGYKECDPMGGYDPYSSSKGCSELITGAYIRSYFNPSEFKRHKIAVASARSGNVLGGGDWSEDRLIPDCIRSFSEKRPIVIRFPEAIRPWQHVLEPLFGYMLLARHLYEDGPEFSGSWNFGPDETDARPVKWIVDEVSRLWGDGATWTLDEGQ